MPCPKSEPKCPTSIMYGVTVPPTGSVYKYTVPSASHEAVGVEREGKARP